MKILQALAHHNFARLKGWIKKLYLLYGKIVTKDGFDRGVQRYKCGVCGKRFKGGSRHSAEEIWHAYFLGKQTYKQLSIYYNYSIKTIQRKIDSIDISSKTILPSVANVLMDTTYFGKQFGAMVFKDNFTGQILFKQ